VWLLGCSPPCFGVPAATIVATLLPPLGPRSTSASQPQRITSRLCSTCTTNRIALSTRALQSTSHSACGRRRAEPVVDLVDQVARLAGLAVLTAPVATDTA